MNAADPVIRLYAGVPGGLMPGVPGVMDFKPHMLRATVLRQLQSPALLAWMRLPGVIGVSSCGSGALPPNGRT